MADHKHTPVVCAQSVWKSVAGVLQSCCSPCPTSQAGNGRSPACMCHDLGSCSSTHSGGLPVLQAAHRTLLARSAGGAKGCGKGACVQVSAQLCPVSRRYAHLISPTLPHMLTQSDTMYASYLRNASYTGKGRVALSGGPAKWAQEALS